MRSILLLLAGVLIYSSLTAQSNDFIVLKKRNNRTLKTYGAGSFLSAKTGTGYQLNGYIKAIRNDSIFLTQQETRLVPTEFGQKVDTTFYTFGLDYRIITEFYFERQFDPVGRRRGFAQTLLPSIMIVGGTGFVALELINTAYRREPLNDSGKLIALGVAAGVAGTGVLINQLNKGKNKVGKKYIVHYMKNPRGN